MSSSRWISPLLACAVIIPVFGCATNQPEIVSQTPPIQHPLWKASYLDLLDRRIAAQQTFPQPPQVQRFAVSPARQTFDQQPAAKPAANQPGFDQRILAAHNRERSGLGLVPLSWNPALARSARRWADYLATTGRFEHAPENYAAPEGENL